MDAIGPRVIGMDRHLAQLDRPAEVEGDDRLIGVPSHPLVARAFSEVGGPVVGTDNPVGQLAEAGRQCRAIGCGAAGAVVGLVPQRKGGRLPVRHVVGGWRDIDWEDAVELDRVDLFPDGGGVRVHVDLNTLDEKTRRGCRYKEVHRRTGHAGVDSRPEGAQRVTGVQHVDLGDEPVAVGLPDGDAGGEDGGVETEGEVLHGAVLRRRSPGGGDAAVGEGVGSAQRLSRDQPSVPYCELKAMTREAYCEMGGLMVTAGTGLPTSPVAVGAAPPGWRSCGVGSGHSGACKTWPAAPAGASCGGLAGSLSAAVWALERTPKASTDSAARANLGRKRGRESAALIGTPWWPTCASCG